MNDKPTIAMPKDGNMIINLDGRIYFISLLETNLILENKEVLDGSKYLKLPFHKSITGNFKGTLIKETETVRQFPTDIVKTYGTPGKGKPLHVIPKPKMIKGNLQESINVNDYKTDSDQEMIRYVYPHSKNIPIDNLINNTSFSKQFRKALTHIKLNDNIKFYRIN